MGFSIQVNYSVVSLWILVQKFEFEYRFHTNYLYDLGKIIEAFKILVSSFIKWEFNGAYQYEMVLRMKWGNACKMLITLQGIWWILNKVKYYFWFYLTPVTGSFLNTQSPLLVHLKTAFSGALTYLPLFLILDLHTFSVFSLSSPFQHAKPPTRCFGNEPKTNQNTSHAASWAFLKLS